MIQVSAGKEVPEGHLGQASGSGRMALGDGDTPELAGVMRRSPLQATQMRWQVLTEQMREGHEPCFQTGQRHACGEFACRWRSRCLSLRAEWLR